MTPLPGRAPQPEPEPRDFVSPEFKRGGGAERMPHIRVDNLHPRFRMAGNLRDQRLAISVRPISVSYE